MKKFNRSSTFLLTGTCRGLTIILLLLISPLASRAQVPDAGVYSIWPGNDSQILNLDHVKGGQIFTNWKDLEPGNGVFDWARLDSDLALMNSLGVKASVQVNANMDDFPDWIFDSVAHGTLVSRSGPNNPEIIYPQFWDPLFLDHTKQFIDALAAHLKTSPYKDNVLLIRQNWNAVATEQYWLSSADQDPSLLTPTPSGHIYDVPYTDELAIAYSESIVDFHKVFLPEIPVAIRAFTKSGGWIAENREANIPSHQNLVDDGFWFYSTSTKPFEQNSELFAGYLEYTKPGLTVGYSENFANLTGLVDPDDTSVSREQGAYWEALWNMHRGVSFLAYRGDDLADPALFDTFEFANKYAGYHASPDVSPGAWIALRPAVINPNMQNRFPDYEWVDNYEFFISQVDPDNTSVGLTQAGPFPAKESYWSRQTNATDRMEFILNSEFRDAISGKDLSIRVAYLDEGLDTWSLLYENAGGEINLGTVAKMNTGLWKEAFFELSNADFIDSVKDLILFSEADGDDIFHMIELILVPEPLAGDFDRDGDVDGADFLKWQRGESPNPLSAPDLTDWQANYGTVAPQTATSTAVPEPGPTAILCAVLLVLMVCSRRGRDLPFAV